jgi:hypothetical protein
MSNHTILLVILLILFIGAMPNWSYSRNWGYIPSTGLGLALGAFLLLALLGTI